MVNGIINVYKEKGFTSFDVVAKMRGIFHQKKIGHTGTLDPDAEGVLPVCLGNATKVCDLLLDKDKEYRTVLLLGYQTDTQDMSGTVLKESSDLPDEETVRSVIKEFVGKQSQIPPMYSALKVNGQKLCDLARQGITVERQPREIEVFSIEIEKIDLPRVTMRIHCSKGTYIRTLCNDIGDKLGCGGAMEKLIRTRVSEFRIEDAHTLKELEEEFSDTWLKSTDSVFLSYDKLVALDQYAKAIDNGNKLMPEMMEEFSAQTAGTRFRVYREDGRFVGLYEYIEKEDTLKPVKLFFES
ncbi:MAG: tRNA pseudouridine(55) synthase TruB [Lachnospiraceae bacterium]|nr:tRNA pseudouridine(55) synthase TruB [Lachnospiraceae bacterium]